jgi:hypothetical protein
MRRHLRSSCHMAVFLLVMAGPAVAAAERPQLAPVRQAENWSALADPTLRTGPLDHLKHLPLGTAGRFLTLGADLRLMQEIHHDEHWGAGRPGTTGSLLVRTLVHADLRWSQGLRFFAQFGSSYEHGRDGGPRPNDRAPLYLNGGFLEIGADNPPGGGLQLRLGRMELFYGSGRVLSFRGRPNIRRSHDGGRLRWHLGTGRLDAFLLWDVQHRDDSVSSRRLADRRLLGLYHQQQLGRHDGLDVYLLSTDRPRQGYDLGFEPPARLGGPEERWSLGSRWRHDRPWLAADLEVIWQWGRFRPDDGTAALDIAAMAVGSRIQVRRTGAVLEAIGLELTWNSGDRDPADSQLNTFRSPYPTGYDLGGGHDLGYGNLALVHPYLRWRPAAKLQLQTGVLIWGRPELQDGSYAMPGRPFLPAADRRLVGWMPELILTRNLAPGAVLRLEITSFEPGAYLDLVTPGRRILFVNPSLTYRF